MKMGLTEDTGQASRHLKENRKEKSVQILEVKKKKKTLKNNKSTYQLTKYLLPSERAPSIVECAKCFNLANNWLFSSQDIIHVALCWTYFI